MGEDLVTVACCAPGTGRSRDGTFGARQTGSIRFESWGNKIDLSKAERALFMKRRKEAYEALHPETRNGGDRRGSDRQVGELKSDRFTADTAAKTGRSVAKRAGSGRCASCCGRSALHRPMPCFSDSRRSPRQLDRPASRRSKPAIDH
jgi:hypothetical protein